MINSADAVLKLLNRLFTNSPSFYLIVKSSGAQPMDEILPYIMEALRSEKCRSIKPTQIYS